jgi:hypothetical protein
MNIENPASMFSERSGVEQSVDISIMRAIVGFWHRK